MKKRNIFRDFNDKKWEQVRTHPYFEDVRTATLAKAEKLLESDPPFLKFSDYHKFVTEGSRKAYGTPAGQYTARMTAFFFAYLLTGDEKYVAPLVDVMWSICDRETWAINAHVKEEEDLVRRRRFLELGSCVTAFRMSEILYYIGDKFPELAYRRIKAEIRYRIIDSFREYTGDKGFWWYTASNNWSAVCGATVFATFLYLAEDEEIDAEIPRFMDICQCFIDGIPDDGCCLEGTGYWSYGFSHYMLFAIMLREYTDGEIDLFKNEKVKKIATFYSHTAINSHQGLSFSDGGMGYSPSTWIMSKLKDIYPEMPIPTLATPKGDSGVLRYILWCNPDVETVEHKLESYNFPIAQWFLHVGDNYAVAAKAGFNKEPHNHNDVGSFMVSKNDEITFCDPGPGEYVKTYFGAGRYTHLVTSARGHSVPIINGHIQCVGTERSTVYTMTDKRFTFTINNGYPEEVRDALETATRDIDCQPDAMILTDRFVFSGEAISITEQFVSLKPIEGENGRLTCGDTVLTYDRDLFDMEISSEDFRRNNGTVETLHSVRLTLKRVERDNTLVFRFE